MTTPPETNLFRSNFCTAEVVTVPDQIPAYFDVEVWSPVNAAPFVESGTRPVGSNVPKFGGLLAIFYHLEALEIESPLL